MKLMRWRLLNVACRPWTSLTSRSPHLQNQSHRGCLRAWHPSAEQQRKNPGTSCAANAAQG